jgi:hypothetical protein
MSDGDNVPMLCQSCGWRGVFVRELMVRGGRLICPQCNEPDQLAQVLGAPLHGSDDK